jgi:hypothetical protein
MTKSSMMIRALGAALGLALATNAAAQLITPPAPVAFQAVRLTLPPSYVLQPYDAAQTTVAMEDNRITVSLQATNPQLSTATGLDVPLGRLPAGVYEVWLAETVPSMPPNGEGVLTSSSAVGMFNVLPLPASPPLPREDYSDLWWDPDEPGWGVQLTQHSNGQVWTTFLTYAQDGQATWYAVMGGTWTDAATFTGPVYKATGPWFGASGGSTNVQAAGTATLAFTSYAGATFSYSIDGVAKSRPLQRQSF